VNRHVNAIAGRLSLRAPQRRSLYPEFQKTLTAR